MNSPYSPAVRQRAPTPPGVQGAQRAQRVRQVAWLAALAMLVSLTACGSSADNDRVSEAGARSETVSTDSQSSSTTASTPISATSSTAVESDSVVGTTIRFSRGDAHVEVTITEDNPTTRDLLTMLPLTLSVEEFNGREKVSYLPRDLDTTGSPGHDPNDGDLIYFAPWGNLGFYYNTAGMTHDDRVIHLGTYEATLDQLTELEGDNVTLKVTN